MKISIDLTAEQRAFAEKTHAEFDRILREAGTNPQAIMMLEGMLLMARAAIPSPLLNELQEKLNAVKRGLAGGGNA